MMSVSPRAALKLTMMSSPRTLVSASGPILCLNTHQVTVTIHITTKTMEITS